MRRAAALLSCALLLAACEQTPAPVLPVAPPPSAAPSPTPPEAVAPPVNHDPTVLDARDRARDDALAPRAAAIVDAFENDGVSLSRDGKRVVYGSDRDGVWEVYLGAVDRPGEAPVAITRGPERALSGTSTSRTWRRARGGRCATTRAPASRGWGASWSASRRCAPTTG